MASGTGGAAAAATGRDPPPTGGLTLTDLVDIRERDCRKRYKRTAELINDPDTRVDPDTLRSLLLMVLGDIEELATEVDVQRQEKDFAEERVNAIIDSLNTVKVNANLAIADLMSCRRAFAVRGAFLLQDRHGGGGIGDTPPEP